LVLLHKIETSVGSISITKTVIGRIVVQSAQKFNETLKLSSHKGKVAKLDKKIGGGSHNINNLDIVMSENGLDIKIFVVTNFGASIGKAANGLIEEVYANIKKITGIEPNSVAVVVAGVFAKKQIVRRNIEVKR
jgi:uncharacterized alkaline shock family protein YloU